MSATRVLVTGASGFIGRALTARMQATGLPFLAQQRDDRPGADHLFRADLAELVGATELTDAPGWQDALGATAVCIHLAGIAHRASTTPERDYEQLNHLASAGLARLAGRAGHRRFVLVSSINAMGDRSGATPLTPTSVASPTDAYGRSKLAAERSVAAIAADAGMELVVIRPPLVYGPGAKGNLLRLMQLAHSAWPVPAILPQTVPANQRSMIGLPNLVELLLRALDHPGLAGRTVLPTDASYSTASLLRQIGAAMGRRVVLPVPVPAALLSALGNLVGRSAFTRRLTASLLIDDAWLRGQPELAMSEPSEQIIADMVAHYLQNLSAPNSR